MTPHQQTRAEQIASKVIGIKKGFVRGLEELSIKCGQFCIVAADEDFCLKKLKDASRRNRLGSRLSDALIESTVRKGLKEGRALAEKSQRDRLRDPWESKLANIPAHLIHRTRDGRDAVTSGDLLKHFLHVPICSAAGQRLAPAMKINGWRRHPSNLVWVGGRTYKGFWRYREARS